jgi:hypothetical protein
MDIPTDLLGILSEFGLPVAQARWLGVWSKVRTP